MLCALVALAGFLGVSYLLIFIVPKFEQMFLDLGIALPNSTIICIKAANYGLGYILLVIGLAEVVKEILIEDIGVRVLMSLIGIVISIVVGGYVYLATVKPLVEMIERLNAGSAT